MVKLSGTVLGVQENDGRSNTESFSLYLRDSALDFYESLPASVKKSRRQLVEAFKRRFYLSDVECLRRMSELWKRQQLPEESVDQYFTAMQKAARISGLISDENLKNAILLGLKPGIRRCAIQTAPKILQELLRTAKISEQAALATGDDGQALNETLKRIEQRLMDATIRARSVSPIGVSNGGSARSRSANTDSRVYDDRQRPSSNTRNLSPSRPSRFKSSLAKPYQQVRFSPPTDEREEYSASYSERNQQMPQYVQTAQYVPQQQYFQPPAPPVMGQGQTAPSAEPQYAQQSAGYQQQSGWRGRGSGRGYSNAYRGSSQYRPQRGSTYYRSSSSYQPRQFRGSSRGSRPQASSNFDDRCCFKCGAQGHISRWCPQKAQSDDSNVNNQYRSVVCYLCGRTGHIARSCMASPNSDHSM